MLRSSEPAFSFKGRARRERTWPADGIQREERAYYRGPDEAFWPRLCSGIQSFLSQDRGWIGPRSVWGNGTRREALPARFPRKSAGFPGRASCRSLPPGTLSRADLPLRPLECAAVHFLQSQEHNPAVYPKRLSRQGRISQLDETLLRQADRL